MKKSNRKQVWEAVKSIMLVYADPIMLQTLNCLLNMNGYQVVNSFQTGRSALRFLKSGPQVDLVLLGCYLQDMDTVRFLRQMEQECTDQRLRVRHVLDYSPMIPGPKQTRAYLSTKAVSDGPMDLPFSVSDCGPRGLMAH